eukprot:9723606-Alexandrium_andersonii.AAC.1
MSASLVGSEMCIRDSRLAMLLAGRVHVGPAHAVEAVNHLGQRRRSRPVSYTHLTLPTICSV